MGFPFWGRSSRRLVKSELWLHMPCDGAFPFCYQVRGPVFESTVHISPDETPLEPSLHPMHGQRQVRLWFRGSVLCLWVAVLDAFAASL